MIVPLTNRVLCKPIKNEKTFQTAAGIILQDVQIPQATKAEVISTGPDVTLCQVGDVVFFGQYAPTEVKENPMDEKMILPEEDILAVLVPDKPAE